MLEKNYNDSTYSIRLNLSDEYKEYAEKAYPSNHTYKISNGALSPKCKLNLRYKKISKLYPSSLNSLVDIGCSKGYFVFSASSKHFSSRNLGIDVTAYDINYCHAIKNYLGDSSVQFEMLQLHELADRINKFGGPYQTALLINAYQYLYFGSAKESSCYQNHDAIFRNLHTICSERVIFNNRVNLSDCQNKDMIKHASTIAQNNYSEQKIIEAASRYFEVSKKGKIGQYPLWILDAL